MCVSVYEFVFACMHTLKVFFYSILSTLMRQSAACLLPRAEILIKCLVKNIKNVLGQLYTLTLLLRAINRAQLFDFQPTVLITSDSYWILTANFIAKRSGKR